eukprot:8602-Amphidinium_carterae.4
MVPYCGPCPFVDWGTGFQLSERVQSKEPNHVVQLMLACGLNPATPWLNARTERSHFELNKEVVLTFDMCMPCTDDEYMAAVAHSIHMVNNLANRSGFSTTQRVLGYMPDMPGCLSDSEAPAMVVFGPLQSVKRLAEIRAGALEAYAKLASRERVQTHCRDHLEADIRELDMSSKRVNESGCGGPLEEAIAGKSSFLVWPG